MSDSRLAPFPRRDRVVGPQGEIATTWQEWFLNLYTVVSTLVSGRASFRLVTTADTPTAATDRLILYADGTTLKVMYPDGTIRTVTVT